MKKIRFKKNSIRTSQNPFYFCIVGGIAAFVFASLLFVALPVLADSYGLSATAGAAKLDRSTNPAELAGQIIGAALSLVGIIFFILMIYSGIIWMSARGNDEQTKKSLHTITAAIIGLIIVLASYAITTFVFESVYGGELAPGSNNTATQTYDSTRCRANTEDSWSCKNILNCSGFTGEVIDACDGGVEPVQCRIDVCSDPESAQYASCQVGLCEGGAEIVCCQ